MELSQKRKDEIYKTVMDSVYGKVGIMYSKTDVNRYNEMLKEISVLIKPRGFGKSEALKEYVKNKSNAIQHSRFKEKGESVKMSIEVVNDNITFHGMVSELEALIGYNGNVTLNKNNMMTVIEVVQNGESDVIAQIDECNSKEFEFNFSGTDLRKSMYYDIVGIVLKYALTPLNERDDNFVLLPKISYYKTFKNDILNSKDDNLLPILTKTKIYDDENCLLIHDKVNLSLFGADYVTFNSFADKDLLNRVNLDSYYKIYLKNDSKLKNRIVELKRGEENALYTHYNISE